MEKNTNFEKYWLEKESRRKVKIPSEEEVYNYQRYAPFIDSNLILMLENAKLSQERRIEWLNNKAFYLITYISVLYSIIGVASVLFSSSIKLILSDSLILKLSIIEFLVLLTLLAIIVIYLSTRVLSINKSSIITDANKFMEFGIQSGYSILYTSFVSYNETIKEYHNGSNINSKHLIKAFFYVDYIFIVIAKLVFGVIIFYLSSSIVLNEILIFSISTVILISSIIILRIRLNKKLIKVK